MLNLELIVLARFGRLQRQWVQSLVWHSVPMENEFFQDQLIAQSDYGMSILERKYDEFRNYRSCCKKRS